jgi:hypothetical protein
LTSLIKVSIWRAPSSWRAGGDLEDFEHPLAGSAGRSFLPRLYS